MTTEEFFDNFLTTEVNLTKICEGECKGNQSGCDICLVTSKYKDLVEELKKELKILPSEDEENLPSHFLTGSYRRHTMIRPPKDVDLFIVLDSGEYLDIELHDLITPKALITRLKSALEKIFEDSKEVSVEEQRHSVTVVYNKKFSIDVIPAFETDDKKAYKIPDIENNQAEHYISSNPKIHYQYINDVNDTTSINGKKRFKKIARLLKFIKRKKFNSEPTKIRSFHFELLAAQILGSDKITSYSTGLNDFLSAASSYFDKSIITDPANKENKIDDYIDDLDSNTKDLIKSQLDSLAKITNHAIELEESGNETEAINEWKKIFYVDQDNSSKGNNPSRTTYVGSSPPKPWSYV